MQALNSLVKKKKKKEFELSNEISVDIKKYKCSVRQ